MKRILDPDFRYRPSFDTDIRETFEKVRREREARNQDHRQTDNQINIVRFAELKKAAS